MSIDRITEITEEGQEGLTKYTATINSDHAYIHKGIAFKSIIEVTGSTTFNIGFKTPASGKFVHWRPALVSSSANNVKFRLYEGDSFTGGTDKTAVNLNRNSSNLSVMQSFKTGVTSTPVGVLIQHTQIGVEGNIFSQAGGGGGSTEERVLAIDTEYVFQIDPNGATTVMLELFWYEEDGYQA